MKARLVPILLLSGCRGLCGKTSAPAPVDAAPPPVVESPPSGPADASVKPLVTSVDESAALAFEPSGARIAVASTDGVTLYDTDGHTLVGHDWETSPKYVYGVSYDAAGKLLRVVTSDGIFVFAARALTLVKKHPSPGEIVAQARDVLVVREGEPEKPRYALVDVSSGRSSALPPSWFAEDATISTSETGDRLAVSETGIVHPLHVNVYDTNRRELVATQTYADTAAAGGQYGGTLTPDGRAVEWCYTRGGCDWRALDGEDAGAHHLVSHYRVRSKKWTVDLPSGLEVLDGFDSLAIRDANERLVGRVAYPTKDADISERPQTAVICAKTDRLVVPIASELLVFALPSGKLVATLPTDGAASALACAPAGDRVAAVVARGREGARLAILDVRGR